MAAALLCNGQLRTTDGKIAIGHNNWVDYIVGERWNIIADIVPEKGNRLFMDMMPDLFIAAMILW